LLHGVQILSQMQLFARPSQSARTQLDINAAYTLDHPYR
jgi:hypothetical protein